MKKIISLVALAIAIISGHAQGTVNFNNRVASIGLDAPVVTFDFTPVSGDAYRAQLYVLTDDRFVAVGTPASFRTGAAAGYFTPSVISIPGHPPGSRPIVFVAVWETFYGSTYEEAAASGHVRISNVWQLLDELGDNEGKPPADLLGLEPVFLYPAGIAFSKPLVLRPSEQTARLVWGDSYPLHWEIDYKTDLNETNWTLLTTGQSTNRLGGIYTDTTATNQARIYRIRYSWPEE